MAGSSFAGRLRDLVSDKVKCQGGDHLPKLLDFEGAVVENDSDPANLQPAFVKSGCTRSWAIVALKCPLRGGASHPVL